MHSYIHNYICNYCRKKAYEIITCSCVLSQAGLWPPKSLTLKILRCAVFDEGSTSVLSALRVAESSWTVSLHGLKLNCNVCPLLTTSPETVTSISDVSLILSKLCSCRVCAGNSDEKFLKLSYLRKGDASGKMINLYM